MKVVKIDRNWRMVIPKELRTKIGKPKRVILEETKDGIIIKPLGNSKLSDFFDKFEVDVHPSSFLDYKNLKKELLK